MNKKDIIQMLDERKIPYKLAEHEAIYTMAESIALNLPDGDAVAKNLFIRDDKKRQYLLLTVKEGKRLDLKTVQTRLGTRRLSFASEEDLQRILGLVRGSVTPLGALNDEERRVEFFIDADFRDNIIGVHPNTNTATVWMQANDLYQIIKQHGNKVEWMDTVPLPL